MQIFFAGFAIYLGAFQVVSVPVHTTGSPRVKRWVELENITFTFDCTNKAIGFYADVEYNCQIFHMCDEEKRRVPHLCANDTSFNQEYRICDWEYNFNCSDAPKWYILTNVDSILLENTTRVISRFFDITNAPTYLKWLDHTSNCAVGRYYLNELTYATDAPMEDY